VEVDVRLVLALVLLLGIAGSLMSAARVRMPRQVPVAAVRAASQLAARPDDRRPARAPRNKNPTSPPTRPIPPVTPRAGVPSSTVDLDEARSSLG
jgi:hypothetical protein